MSGATSALQVGQLELTARGTYTESLSEFWFVELDRDAILTDAIDGHARLPLGPQSLDVVLTEESFIAYPTPMITSDDGIPRPDPNYNFPSRFFSGEVSGAPTSHVLLTITQAGVSGWVRTAESWVHFQPLAFSSPAEGPVHVVFPHEAIEYATNLDHIPGVTDASAGRGDTEVTEGVPSPGIDTVAEPSVMVKADHLFYADHGANWWSKVDSIWAEMRSLYSRPWGSPSQHSRFACTTSTACAGEGISTYNVWDLMPAWVNYEVPRRSLWTTPWTQAVIFTGGTTLNWNGSGLYGLGFNPGRFAVIQVEDEAKYDGRSVNYEAAVLLTHEFGHNYDAEHTSAATNSHCHGTACSAGWFTHYSYMHESWVHEPGTDRTEMMEWASHSSADIDDCIQDAGSTGWHARPYTITWPSAMPVNGCS